MPLLFRAETHIAPAGTVVVRIQLQQVSCKPEMKHHVLEPRHIKLVEIADICIPDGVCLSYNR